MERSRSKTRSEWTSLGNNDKECSDRKDESNEEDEECSRQMGRVSVGRSKRAAAKGTRPRRIVKEASCKRVTRKGALKAMCQEKMISLDLPSKIWAVSADQKNVL